MSKNCTKMHHRIMHALPFVPSRKRQKGFEITRHYGSWSLTMRAFETLNHYDLITLLMISREYIRGNYVDLGYSSTDERRRVRIRIDIEKIIRERGLNNKKSNRMSFLKSLLRFYQCSFEVKDQNGVCVSSWIISDAKYDHEQAKWAEIDCNARFLEYCARGIMVNWKRLSQYKDNGIAVILDTYLQGTKVKKDGRWQYRKWISEETVCDLLDPFGTQRLYKVRQQAREAFGLMAVHGMPRYEYDKVYKRWIRQDVSLDHEV
jgi:hypothetical protein